MVPPRSFIHMYGEEWLIHRWVKYYTWRWSLVDTNNLGDANRDSGCVGNLVSIYLIDNTPPPLNITGTVHHRPVIQHTNSSRHSQTQRPFTSPRSGLSSSPELRYHCVLASDSPFPHTLWDTSRPSIAC